MKAGPFGSGKSDRHETAADAVHPRVRCSRKRKREQRIMDREKIKKLEAQLHQMMALINAPKKDKSMDRPQTGDVRVIRRRKGQPDLKIA